MIELLCTLPIERAEELKFFTDPSLFPLLASELLDREIKAEEIVRLSRRLLDTSDRNALKYRVSLILSLDDKTETYLTRKYSYVREATDLEYKTEKSRLDYRPIVVGSGPAGLFAALILAEAGARPILFERGGDVDERKAAVKRFMDTGELDGGCNVQFGEGGAGTFSDGKLKPGRLDSVKYKILSEFVSAGAPEEILYRGDAHIGTDNLCTVVKNIRKKIISLGGEVHFNCHVTDITVEDHRVSAVTAGGKEYPARGVILATGHSARDVFYLLREKGASLEAKSFGIGVRAEHPQEHIDRIMYGRYAGREELGASSYHLVTHLKNGRSVYSFCMCPGGTVVAAASDADGVVTNGMSVFARDGANANAALLVSVDQRDFGSDDPLAGVELQRALERRAFSAGGGGHRAVSQRMEDLINGVPSTGFGEVKPTYGRGCRPGDISEALPEYIVSSLREAIRDFDEWMLGYYYPDAVLTGSETRSTSPVRVLRGDGCEAVGIAGLYPSGEGAGYAGGILSAACDGIRCAEALLRKA